MYSIVLTCLSATQAIVQLIDSSERADTLLSKRTGVGFEPVTLWLQTRGTNHYTTAAHDFLLQLLPLHYNFLEE